MSFDSLFVASTVSEPLASKEQYTYENQDGQTLTFSVLRLSEGGRTHALRHQFLRHPVYFPVPWESLLCVQ